ncbi:phosphomannomutase/phosphoglucomutase [Candidatus Zixiibacteriota bacterium]
MNPHIFREYDIRGIADDDLTDDMAFNIGRAYGSLLRRLGGEQAVLGYDARMSGPRLHQKVAEGLMSCGLKVLDLGMVPTPTVYFAEKHTGSDGGIQVTGSHNPAEYNGFKMTARGNSVHGEEIQGLRKLIEEEDFETGEGSLSVTPLLDEYLAAIIDRVDLKAPPSVVIDAGNGIAGPAAERLFRDLGCTLEALYCEPDGAFPNHLADPTVPEFMADLRKMVLEKGADIGIGFDGDGDRIGLIDSGGRMIFGDQLLAIFARDVLERLGEQKILFDVKCSQGLVEDIEAHGGIPHMWKTGHSLIKAEMKRSGVPIAGEMSGHMFFEEGWFGFDDALYAGARLLDILGRWNVSLAEVVDTIPAYFSTPELRVGCADSDKFDVVAEITARFMARDDVEVIDIDGARVIFDGGWGLVRASNTQPVIVLRFEGRSEQVLEKVRAEFTAVLKDFPSVAVEELEAGGAGH